MIAVELDRPGPGTPPPAPPAPPSWPRRLLAAYSVALIAIGAGAVPVLVGLELADRCTRPGFGCLGYGLFGWGAGLLLGALVLLVLTLAFRLGALFWPVAVLLLVAPPILSNGAVTALAVPALAPAVAVWASAPPRAGTPPRRRVPARVLRIAAALALGLLVPVVLRRFS